MWSYSFGFRLNIIFKTKRSSLSSLPSFHRIRQYQASSKSAFGKLLLTRAKHQEINEMRDCLPFFAKGQIVKGFGRGSKELGIPTANYPLEVVKNLPAALETGIYYGWANVDNGEVHKMVMSIGWNPFYENKEKSMETHIMHEFNRDLYGCLLKVCIAGYIRPEKNFSSLDELIAAINDDIAKAKTLLDSDTSACKLKYSDFFQKSDGDDKVIHATNGNCT